jgi:hypothetical protein
MKDRLLPVASPPTEINSIRMHAMVTRRKVLWMTVGRRVQASKQKNIRRTSATIARHKVLWTIAGCRRQARQQKVIRLERLQRPFATTYYERSPAAAEQMLLSEFEFRVQEAINEHTILACKIGFRGNLRRNSIMMSIVFSFFWRQWQSYSWQ